MGDILNILGRAFSRRHVDTLLRLIHQYTYDPDSLTIICNEFQKVPEYVSLFEGNHAQIMADPVNVDKQVIRRT